MGVKNPKRRKQNEEVGVYEIDRDSMLQKGDQGEKQMNSHTRMRAGHVDCTAHGKDRGK